MPQDLPEEDRFRTCAARNNESDVNSAHQNLELGNTDTEDRVSVDQNIEEVTSVNTVDLEEALWVANTSASLVSACSRNSSCEEEDEDWDALETFLSDKTISKRKKKLVLDKDCRCRDWAFCYGAPVSVIKHLVEIEGPAIVGCTVLGENEGSWLHKAIFAYSSSFEVMNLLVTTGGKGLVCLQSNYVYAWKRTAFHMLLGHLRRCSPEIIHLFCKVGGEELLEIPDKNGFLPLDYTNASHRSMMIESLTSLEQSKGIQSHIKTLKSLVLSPKEFHDYIDRRKFETVRSYLERTDVSRDAKMRCLKFRDPFGNRSPFFRFCNNHGPPDIAHTVIELMGDDFLLTEDSSIGYTFLHFTCNDETLADHINLENQYELVKVLIRHGGTKLLHKRSKLCQETALHLLVQCNKINMKAINLMIEAGGEELIFMQQCRGETVLHLVSQQKEPNKELILYLLSKGGSRLKEIRDDYGRKAEEYWTPEIEEYITLSTSIPPSLLEELQCPICFETMSNVHIITQCCHRFCQKCIMESFRCSGNNCPVCRTKYELSDLRKDPLLGKFAMELFAGKKRERALQDRNKALMEEVANLKRKRNNI